MRKFLTLVLLCLCAPAAVLAQGSPSSQPSTRRSTPAARVDFTGSTIRGETVGPGVELVKAGHRARFKSLLRVRADFRPELRDSAAGL